MMVDTMMIDISEPIAVCHKNGKNDVVLSIFMVRRNQNNIFIA